MGQGGRGSGAALGVSACRTVRVIPPALSPTPRLHPIPPHITCHLQVISHAGVSHRITVEGEESSAKVVAADINAGCPAVVHVVDGVLLPNLS